MGKKRDSKISSLCTEKTQKDKQMLNQEKALELYFTAIEYINKGDLEKALFYLNSSSELHSHYKTYYKQYEILKKVGLDDKSFEFLKKAYSLNSNNDLVAYNYAKELEERKMYKESIKILETLLERNSCCKSAKILLEDLKMAGHQIR